MTIVHKGIRRKTTDVAEDYGLAFYAQNWRFKRIGEIGRRPGIGKSNMARLTGPVRSMICGNLFFPYLVQVNDAGDVDATLSPEAHWTDPVMRIPDGIVGQAQAPTIVSITPSPASGALYPAGNVSFTAVVVYDGLSGPLTYSWTNFIVGPGIPTPITMNANPMVLDFNAGCIPGVYSYAGVGGLTVTTAIGGLSHTLAPDDYTVA